MAEISHARYGLLNTSVWVAKLLPILDARIDALDLKASDRASLCPVVEKALDSLLAEVAEKMSAPPKPGAAAFLAKARNAHVTLFV